MPQHTKPLLERTHIAATQHLIVSYFIKKTIQAEVTNANHASVESSDKHLSRVFQ